MRNVQCGKCVKCSVVLLLLAGLPLASFGQELSPQVPLGNGDVNGDGRIDLSDAIYILNWKFLTGPAPVPLECSPPAPGSQELEPSRHQNLDFSTRFAPQDCRFLTEGTSTFFVLEPGYQLVLAGEEDGVEKRTAVTVVDELEVVGSVATRVVEEREWEDGKLVEVSRNFVALCEQTGDLYYFGESVDTYEGGEIVSHEVAWRAGEDGAEAGVLLPGSPLIGARHYHYTSPKAAADRAEVIAILDAMEVEAGEFEDVLFVYETNALEFEEETDKFYAPGVGLIKDGGLQLVEFGFLPVK